MSLLSRAIGVIATPKRTFEAVVEAPRPAPILFVVCLVAGLASAAPLLTASGRAMVERQFDQFEARVGQSMPPEIKEQQLQWGPYFAFGSQFVQLPVASVVVAAVAWALLNIVLAGHATFKQSLGVVTHSYVIYALGTVLGAPLVTSLGEMSPAGPFHLGALVPDTSQGSFAAALAASLSAFGLWQSVVLGLGLSVLYRVRATWISLGALVGYVVFAAIRATAFLAAQGMTR